MHVQHICAKSHYYAASQYYVGGVLVSVVRRMNEVTRRRARLVLGWVTAFGLYTITVRNQPTRSTQPCTPSGLLNRVPASAGGKGWSVASAGLQVTLRDPMWHMSSSSGVTTSVSELLYPCYVTQMRPVVTDGVAWSVDLSVCRSRS